MGFRNADCTSARILASGAVPMAVLAYLFVVVVLLGAKKNFWCDVGASVDEDPSVVAEVGRLLSLLRQKV